MQFAGASHSNPSSSPIEQAESIYHRLTIGNGRSLKQQTPEASPFTQLKKLSDINSDGDKECNTHCEDEDGGARESDGDSDSDSDSYSDNDNDNVSEEDLLEDGKLPFMDDVLDSKTYEVVLKEFESPESLEEYVFCRGVSDFDDEEEDFVEDDQLD